MSDKIKINEVRIRPISDDMYKTITNISQNYGITCSSLLKPLIGKLIDETPERYKQNVRHDSDKN